MTRTAALLSVLLPLAPGFAAAAAPADASRTAIVVGANAAALGRSALRHARRDSEAIADVLRSVGRFDARRVHVLHDPSPDEILRLVEREAAALAGNPRGMLLFYYSGHADRDALYPGGKPLALDRLRRVLDRPDVAVRVGVIDACQGGAWTRAKGLVPDAPFEVTIPAVLGSEGSALIASSSGVESAHESDLLQGSFFTYHFAAALRGAGDQSGDGTVTLTEAFEYARERTIRDSARLSPEPQHPSYALNVRGRQDIVLAHVADSPSTLAVEQQEGPLELVHLASGLRVLELPSGPRSVRLAVPPGKYLVRKVAAEGIRTREIAVPRDGAAEVGEGDLVLLGNRQLAVKGERSGRARGVLPEDGGWDVGLGFEVAKSWHDRQLSIAVGETAPYGGALRVDGRVGLTDEVTWKIGTLAFAYRLGERGRAELVPYAGLLGWSTDGDRLGLRATFGAGVGGRLPFGPAALVATATWRAPLVEGPAVVPTPDHFAQVGLGLTLRVGRFATLHGGAALALDFLPATEALDPYAGEVTRYPGTREFRWSIGSVQELGLATLPLLAVHAPRGWSLDLHATVEGPDAVGSARAGISRRF
jgi:hypothetical protein